MSGSSKRYASDEENSDRPTMRARHGEDQTRCQQTTELRPYRALVNFLENHARDGGICTHTSLTGRPHPGAYTILLEERNEFLNLYHKALVHQQTEGLYLTERTGDLFRFFVDLDGDQAVIMHIAEVFDDHFWKVMRRIFDDIVYEELGDFPSTVSITELHKVHINYKGAVTFAEEACRLVDLAKQRLVEAYRNEGGTGLADEMMDKIFDKSVYRAGLRMLGSSKVNKGPYRVVSTNLNNRPPTFEILEACSIHPDIEDPVERALYERRKPEVPVSRQRQGSEAGGGGGGGPIVLDGVDEEIKAVIVAFHASLVERMPDVPRTIHRLDVLGDGILVKFRDLSVCPFVNRVHARNKPTVYMFINKTRCSLRCFDENCRNSFKPVLMDAALAEAMERRHAPAGAQPLQRRDPVALHRYIQSLPAIKIQIPAAILPKRVVFGSSWEGDLFLATELFDGGRAFNLHTCQGPERPHASALVTFKKDRASGCVCFRTDSTGHRILMPQCAIYPSRSLWPVVGIDLHFQADQEEGEIRLPRLPQQRLIPLHDSQEINLILNELQNTHLDTGLAELFVQIQGNRFIRYLTKDDAWATFEKHVWEIGPRLSGAVGAIVKGACVPVLKHAISTFVAHARGGGDNNEQEGNVALSKEDAKFLAKLLEAKKHIEGTHGQNCVAQQLQTIECMVAKTESDFRGRLNKESHLFAFSNGVFDMRQGRFRPVEPEDMISINCGRAYDHEKINDVAARERVTDIVMGIFANVTEVGDFFMLELAGALGGHNLSQTMSCLLGGGANGKSTLLSLIMASFGNYVKTMYSSWITGLDKDSDSCTNQLIFVENARLIVISEMNEKEKVNKRRLKMLTGGDTIPIRGIREAFRDFRARAKLMCFTNYMPSFFGSVLHADMRRIRVYPMKMKYVADPDANNPFEAKIDRWLEASIAQLGDAFLGVLFDLYPRYISEEGSPDSSRPMPLTMVDAATDAFNSMDPLRSLITATYEKTADVNQYITTEEVISLAREHEKSLGELVFPVGRTKLLHGLDMILVGRILLGDERKILVGRSYVRGWRGWKRMDDEEEEE